ncbi:DUF1896 family protein [Cytophagaceae bacterium DM2B3-1]|uniref:DUF1896 family protein n=1 Tax=Xanthocytophaga flava TaxID=3048013 RepID=A0ABT7CX97_9BACT|nr:DUF1896 family protein [Xanthocytophaga flavus]MDJ1497585.1 DUF1896 family protein [Xanthocytophaga flavus]
MNFYQTTLYHHLMVYYPSWIASQSVEDLTIFLNARADHSANLFETLRRNGDEVATADQAAMEELLSGLDELTTESTPLPPINFQ